MILDLGVDTTTPSGEMIANVMATFAQFERRAPLDESDVGGGVVDACNALVFVEVDGENSASGRGHGASCVGTKVHADRDTLRLPHLTACLDFFSRRREPCEHPVVQGR